MRRVLLLALLLNLAALPVLGLAGPAAQAAVEDWSVPGGRFYTQTAGRANVGFAVIDGEGVPFWTAVQQAGGIPATGYPISTRFEWNGFTVQAFQKVILQWQPNARRVAYLNVFDLLHDRGYDAWLREQRAVPEPVAVNEVGQSWEQIVRGRQSWLDANPAIRAQYFSVANPIEQYGLPTSPVTDYGSVRVVRLQRAVIQQWLVDTPWAWAGQVTVANGGDVAKESGILPAAALVPTSAPALGPSPLRAKVRADAPLQAAIDVLDGTRAARSLVETLATSDAAVVVGDLPDQVRGAYLPFLRTIIVSRTHLSNSTEAIAAIIGHEAVHLDDDVNGLFDGSAWQCYQSELRAFMVTAEIWNELYPGGKPNPRDELERELNNLVRWHANGTDLDRLYSLAERYGEQCG